MFSAMLMDAYRHEHPEMRIAYRTDGQFLNSRCMQAPKARDLLFADDCAHNTVTKEDIQRSTDLFVNTEAELATSTAPASDPTTTTTRTSDNNFIDAPQPTITDTILPPMPSAPITANNSIGRTPTTSGATIDYLPPATSNRTTAPVPAMGNRYYTVLIAIKYFPLTSACSVNCESITPSLAN
ncbi:unnamed protein product [Schistocephalus solidus]|uniref:Uncharacterized protein n=1 Tax=Schistocephalus solidus TaxID=70667 RepID=A0A183SQD9_SCHSO|nr:unnamed protein product [Schistocephalus solidus]